MTQPLTPKATAVWLVENTTLTFQQIAEFCGLHELEVQAIADGEVSGGIMRGLDPVTAAGQVTHEEIKRCEGDPESSLALIKKDLPQPKVRGKGPRYTPISKRGDKPDAVAWLVKNFPQLSFMQITKLIGTTKATIASVRDRTHWNSSSIKPRSPLELGLCTSADLESAVQRAGRRISPEEYAAMRNVRRRLILAVIHNRKLCRGIQLRHFLMLIFYA